MRVTTAPRIAMSIITAALVTIALALPTAASASAPVNGKYRSYAYIAATRHGSAVYINGLVKQDYSSGLIRSHARTIYLQRNLNGAWQTMLSRVTDWQGKFTVGFVSIVSYQYRYLVTESGSAWGTTSGHATPSVLALRFDNCTATHRYYPHGIGKPGAHDHTSGTPVTTFYLSTTLYQANTELDRDRDGIACEKT
jgi:hypothetical protein